MPGPETLPGPKGPQGLQGLPGDTELAGEFANTYDTSVAEEGMNSTDCVMGTVALTAGIVTSGMLAEGQVLSVNSNPVLFSLLGTKYGGNGLSTFALPDLRPITPNHMTYYICTQGVYPSRY